MACFVVMQWGMADEIGFVYYGEDHTGPFDFGSRSYSEQTAAKIDEQVKKILDEVYVETKKTVLEHREQGEAIALALLKYETLSGDEVNALLRGETLDKPSITDLLDAEMPSKPGKARPVSADPDPEVDLGGGTLPQPS